MPLSFISKNKVIEFKNFNSTLKIIESIARRAMEVVMLEDRPRQAAEYAARAGRLMVRLGK